MASVDRNLAVSQPFGIGRVQRIIVNVAVEIEVCRYWIPGEPGGEGDAVEAVASEVVAGLPVEEVAAIERAVFAGSGRIRPGVVVNRGFPVGVVNVMLGDRRRCGRR